MSTEAVTVQAEPARGVCIVRWWGWLRNKEQVIYETTETETTPDSIMRALSVASNSERGFVLPAEAGRRKGWAYHRVECWWYYDDPSTIHRQWSLTVD